MSGRVRDGAEECLNWSMHVVRCNGTRDVAGGVAAPARDPSLTKTTLQSASSSSTEASRPMGHSNYTVRINLFVLPFPPSSHSILLFLFHLGLSSLKRRFKRVLLGGEVSSVSWLGCWDEGEEDNKNK